MYQKEEKKLQKCIYIYTVWQCEILEQIEDVSTLLKTLNIYCRKSTSFLLEYFRSCFIIFHNSLRNTTALVYFLHQMHVAVYLHEPTPDIQIHSSGWKHPLHTHTHPHTYIFICRFLGKSGETLFLCPVSESERQRPFSFSSFFPIAWH